MNVLKPRPPQTQQRYSRTNVVIALGCLLLLAVASAVDGFSAVVVGGFLIAAAMVVLVSLLRRTPDAVVLDTRNFTPPYGVPKVKPIATRMSVKTAPSNGHGRRSGSGGGGAGRKPSASEVRREAGDKLDYDAVGRLVHSLRSKGFATFRAKTRPEVEIQQSLKTGQADVFIRDDRSNSHANLDAVKAEESADSLLSYVSSGVKNVGWRQAGWTVVQSSESQAGDRWSAVLQSRDGAIVTLNLVSPKVFNAAIRGTTHPIEVTREHPAHGFSQELRNRLN